MNNPVDYWYKKYLQEKEKNEELIKTFQQKQEWSEEDEELLNIIIDNVKGYDAYTGCILLKFALHENKIKLLKSLKERYAWKPSDEQINTLWDAIVYVEGCNSNFKGNGSVLENLYLQLKKLK